MMKKLIVMGIVAVMVMAVAGGASAANWIWFLHAENELHQAQLVDATFGQMTPGTGMTNNNYPPAANVLVALSYTANANGAYLNKDYRATVEMPATYDVFLIAGSSYADSKMYLKGWAPSATFQEKSTWYLTSEDGKTTYWSGAVPVATSSSLAPVLYAFDTSTTGIRLKLTTATAVVPEPGSMVALFSGLVGLVGYGIRRRK